MSEVLWLAAALLLVLEGLFPALAPTLYKRMMKAMSEKDERSLRMMGLVMIGVGALLVFLLK